MPERAHRSAHSSIGLRSADCDHADFSTPTEHRCHRRMGPGSTGGDGEGLGGLVVGEQRRAAVGR